MKHTKLLFSSATQLGSLIDGYFKKIEGEYHTEEKPLKAGAVETITQKVWDREPEPATITGLAYHLGFTSRQELEDYDHKAKLSDLIKRARLRIETEYEKKLHQQSPASAIFALKSMGWGERLDNETAENASARPLTIKIVESGPRTANSEKDVVL